MKMPSITLSQLRDTQRLKAWLRAGKTVELRERNRVIAHIVPVKHGGKTK
jgi:antitoxin (DNA-binding transcriptional repressor) of toxin-antitoxin stability system